LNQPDLPAETLRKLHRDLGQGAFNLGNLHRQRSDGPLALENYREAAAHFELALKTDPEDQRNTLDLAICYRLLALSASGQELAWQTFEKAHSRLGPLVRANPRIDAYRREFIKLLTAMTQTARRLNRHPQAKSAIQAAREQIEALLAEHPGNAPLLLNALTIYRTIADLIDDPESLAEDLPPLETLQELALKLRQSLTAETSTHRIRGEFAIELLQLGEQFRRLNRLDMGLKLSQLGAAISGELAVADAGNIDYQFNHQFALSQLAQLHVLSQQYPQAREAYAELLKALAKLESQLQGNPELAFERGKLLFENAKTNNALAGISLATKDWNLAREELKEAQRLLELLIAEFPNERAFFQQELDQTLRLQTWLNSRPAMAEKPQAAP
jgi:tetratricopeptide (TPR) repeat protein